MEVMLIAPAGYLSINATSLEPGQEGLDLREWWVALESKRRALTGGRHEKGWITYLDCLEEKGEDRLHVP